MNRIRKINNIYQVLITPTHKFDTGYELMLGQWRSPHLSNFEVIQSTSYDRIKLIALQMPDINWTKFILEHKSAYHDLHVIIKEHLTKQPYNATYEPNIMAPNVLKNTMFDRVMNYGNEFRLVTHMNDLITFHISCPKSKLKELASIFLIDTRMRITDYITQDNIIKMKGDTIVGTNYEIYIQSA